MNYLIHGATLTFVWFLAINVAMSAAVAWIARRDLPSESSAFWFAIRLLPSASALVFVAAIFMPSYWRYEPRDTTEAFDVTLTALAIVALAILGRACARGVAAWRRASGRARVWMQTARPLLLAGTRVPAFEIEADAPIMALVGLWRPRLLITRGLVNALTPDEFSAAVAHELGHSRAWDNLKRLAMCAAPDLLHITGAARPLERRWASAAERAADRLAGDDGPAARCALASALVKVARLTIVEPSRSEPISTLIGGGEITFRVRRLLDDHASTPGHRRASRLWAACALALITAGAGYAPLLQAVHYATEVLVQSLP